MKSITLQPSSLLVGAAFVLLAVVAMGQKTVPVGTPAAVASPTGQYADGLQRKTTFVVHPRDYVQIKEGIPFTVPFGKILMFTGLGSGLEGHGASISYFVSLVIDGQIELSANIDLNSQGEFWSSGGVSVAGRGDASGPSVRPVPPGLTALAGQAISVGGGHPSFPDDARAWGYLVNE